ncbi:LppX_LprAFG lipoprotein [Nocardioides sp. T2.26MG-1]|uniref:LppX_LprAFG lipoprotein n=1 Tax=Nocardioides sp. T2.26MG-1 TaxID=3041166 RepID=UPI00253FEB80|nr:LppX_LprAFG lipoprotein [Nocardioides sp. T2.26MG-1]
MLLHPRAVPALLAAALAAVSLAACSGSSDSGAAPEDALATAQQTLEDTSGVELTLTTDDLPDGVTGVEKAEGVLTSAPAFDGTITVPLMGQAVEVPIIAVDGKVYAEVPFTAGWQDVDPAEYGAPDPARLMSADEGFTSVLAATTDLDKGDSVRGGKDNSEVLTEYTGTVPGDVVANVIPSASGDFDATYEITDDGELRSAELTGVFYQDSESMTYTITFEEYGTEKDITAP